MRCLVMGGRGLFASPKLRNLKIILLLVSIDSKRVKLLIFKTKKTEKPQP